LKRALDLHAAVLEPELELTASVVLVPALLRRVRVRAQEWEREPELLCPREFQAQARSERAQPGHRSRPVFFLT
jgi:hypothetical protein